MLALLPSILLFGVASAMLTWCTRRYALRQGLLDVPGARRSHSVPTPRGGGISIVLVVLAVCVWLAWRWQAQAPAITLFALGLLLVAGIGWLDDHRPLPAAWRFAVHVVSAALLASALALESLPGWQVALGGLVAVSLVNIWNFMDGINGLAASQAVIAAAGFSFVLPTPWAWIGYALLAACLGFLPFNFPRARIFLGDAGSGALGYVVAALATLCVARAPSPFLVLLPLLVFCVDAGFTLLRRVLRAERWWQPHTTHAYQRAARRLGHPWVTSVCALFSMTGTIIMLMAWQLTIMAGLVITFAVLAFASLIWMRQQSKDLPGTRKAK